MKSLPKRYQNSHCFTVEGNLFFSLLARKAEMHSFPTMYIMGGRLVEMGQNGDFLKKVPKNSDFEGHNSGSHDLFHGSFEKFGT